MPYPNTTHLDTDTEEVEDKFIDSNIDINDLDTGVRSGIAGMTMEDLANRPGGGVPVVALYRKPPALTNIPTGKGSRKKAGRPKFEPNDEQRKYVFECLAIDGDELKSIAHNLGICYDTLVKHFSYEIQLGKQKVRGEIRGILLRQARLGLIDARYKTSPEFYAKMEGMVTDSVKLDHTSSDGSMSPSPAVLLMPPSPHRNDYQEAPQPSSASKKDKPVKKPVTKKSAKKPTKKSTKKE